MIINPVKINDIAFKKFLTIILAIQVAMLAVVGLEAAGLYLPFLPQVVGFIYLSFVPGILILRVLKLHRLSTAETLGYSVGLSVASVMFIGLIVNLVGPILGISHPLSPIPLIIAFSIVVFILCGLSYARDKDFSEPSFIAIKDILSSPVLFLLLLPLLAILGALLVRFYHSNTLLLLLMVLIASVPAFIAFNKFIPVKWYPLAIITISLALLYHLALISGYLNSSDVMLENYFCQLTLLNSHWDSTIAHDYNAMLSDTILPVVYSRLLSLESTWVFKVIYPIFVSVAPLVLYQAFARQVGSRVAFLAVFLFMSPGFVGVGVNIAKTAIAWLFLALLILLMVNKEMTSVKRAALMIIFAACLMVSHYATSYTIIIILLLAFPLMYGLYARKGSRVGKTLSGTFVTLVVIMAFSWYMDVGGSSIFTHVVGLGDHIYTNLSEFLNPFARGSVALEAFGMMELSSIVRQITRVLYYLIIFFTIVGTMQVLRAIVRRDKLEFEPEFVAMGLVSLAGWLAIVFIPYFGWAIGGSGRFFLISLFFVAPVCILGGEASFRFLARLFGYVSQASPNLRLVGLLVLIPFFLYSIGFAYEVTGDIPHSIPLSMERMEQSDDPDIKAHLNMSYTYERAIYSARWLSQKRETGIKVYADRTSINHVLACYGMIYPSRLISTEYPVEGNAYIYLNHLNVVDNLVYVVDPKVHIETAVSYRTYSIAEILPHLDNKVYTNGESEIYFQTR